MANSVSTPWLTMTQGAAYVHMDVQPFRELVYSGKIPSHKRSERRIFVNARDLDAMMDSLPSAARVPDGLVVT